MRLLRTVMFQLLIATWVVPCLAQTPPGASSVEVSFWESVKDSKDPAELQAYLDKYPNGAFSALAKIRLDRLKGTSAQGSSSVSPAPASAAQSDPFPKAGDTWTYRYTDLWKPGDHPSVSHTVKRVSPSEILDARSGPMGTDEFAYTAKPTVIQRAGGVYEFSPYHLLFMTLRPGEAFRLNFASRDSPNAWSATVRVVATETVNVPAGEFDAVRVELKATRASINFNSSNPTRMTQVIWYSSRVKRVVKYSVLTEGASGPSDRDLYELVSYTLN